MKRRNIHNGDEDPLASPITEDDAEEKNSVNEKRIKSGILRLFSAPRLPCVCLVAFLVYPMFHVAWTASRNTIYSSSSKLSSSRPKSSSSLLPRDLVTQQETPRRRPHDDVDDLLPAPSHKAHPRATPYPQPIFDGQHRADQDAVFAFAEGYPLDVYVTFLTSLRRSGYTGDVVLSISSVTKLQQGVENYLRQQCRRPDHTTAADARMNTVVYSIPWECFAKDGKPIGNVKSGFSNCKANLYQYQQEALPDPRQPRPVATARYELYWIWSTYYQPNSRIMLIDVRDSYFQRQPFVGLPKLPTTNAGSGSGGVGGLLHLYLENLNATSISRSAYNRRWIMGAYGEKFVKQIANEPVICSGSTAGDQIAVEYYLRLMVKQFDDTKCLMTGCDQGMHNYLYYFVLKNLPRQQHNHTTTTTTTTTAAISQVVLYKQGEGNINNLAAMRTQPLREWGVLQKDTNSVLNWNGDLSPVAHQFDRDVELKRHIKEITRQFMKEIQN